MTAAAFSGKWDFLQPSPNESSLKQWHGLPVSGGVVHGIVHVLKEDFDEPEEEGIETDEQVEHELERLKIALKTTHGEIEAVQRQVEKQSGRSEAEIFETHLLILEDPSILEQVSTTVRERRLRVDAVYYQLMTGHINALRGKADPYLRERFIDIKDVTQRVMRHLRGELLEVPMFDHPVIVVAHDLTPSDTVQLDRSQVLGFAVDMGSAVSHAAIIARSLNVPAVLRLSGVSDQIHSGDVVLLDGDRGVLTLNPTEEMLSDLRTRLASAKEQQQTVGTERHSEAVTLDGVEVIVGANAEFLEEIPALENCGADEIGLFRTEFLHLADPHSSESKLANAYGRVMEAMGPKLVVFRTLDLGGDKVDPEPGAEVEPNPFLGWRGLRLSLGKLDLFRRQLRALLRAASGRRVGIMFPMVTTVDELRRANAILASCGSELAEEGVVPPQEILVGAMIEVPGAALLALALAEHVDFFSIGTNDLIQYTLAVDRLNDRVADLYQPTHPGVLELIRLTLNAGLEKEVRVAMCGEMAGDLRLTPLLLGIGLREFSVATGQVPRLKHAIRQFDLGECQALADRCQGMGEPEAILAASLELAMRAYPALLKASRPVVAAADEG